MKPVPASEQTTVDPERWLDEYGDWLYQFALARVQDSHASEDLVQETLIAGFRGFEKFQNRSTVKTWLTSILRRRIADHFEKTGRQRRMQDRLNENGETDEFAFSVQHAHLYHPSMSNREFGSSIERDEFRSVMQRCLDKLPVHLSQAFLSRIQNDEDSLEDLGDKLGVTKGNLGVRLFRSRMLLRECLERFWTRSRES